LNEATGVHRSFGQISALPFAALAQQPSTPIGVTRRIQSATSAIGGEADVSGIQVDVW
jgi:hypothetical protein